MFPVDFPFKNKETNTSLVTCSIHHMHFFFSGFFQVLKPIYQQKVDTFCQKCRLDLSPHRFCHPKRKSWLILITIQWEAIGCSFKLPSKVGVEESIVNGQQI
jgi:hypothetical protein